MIRLFKKKEIPSKNYIIVIIVTILVVLLMIFIRSFYLNYKSSKLSESIFSSQTVNQIHMDDFDFAIREVSNSILYVSYTGSNEIYSMEKKLYKEGKVHSNNPKLLYKELENNNLLDKIIYLDITKYTKGNKYINILKNKFPNIDNEINSAPMFIYIKDGAAVEAMSSEIKMIDYKTVNKLVNKYEIE